MLSLKRQEYNIPMTINYGEKIPNNVSLGEDRRLRRALESWQPGFLDWWQDLGPKGIVEADIQFALLFERT